MSRSRPYSNAAECGLVLQHLALTPAEQQRLLPALSWFGWKVPVGVQLLTVAVITIGLIGLAARMFRTTE
jgi:ABC-2 type transport system permease protein